MCGGTRRTSSLLAIRGIACAGSGREPRRTVSGGLRDRVGVNALRTFPRCSRRGGRQVLYLEILDLWSGIERVLSDSQFVVARGLEGQIRDLWNSMMILDFANC